MTIGRPLQFDPEAALDTATEVFWSGGYEGTSLQDLLEAMRLSKSSFYQAFGSKKQLFARCLGRYRENLAETMLARLEEAVSGRQFIEDMLYSAAAEARKESKPRGCLVMNTANEFAQSDEAVAGCVARSMERFRGVFAAAVRRGQEDGSIPEDKDPEALALYLVSNMSGLKTLAMAGFEESESRDIVRVVLAALA